MKVTSAYTDLSRLMARAVGFGEPVIVHDGDGNLAALVPLDPDDLVPPVQEAAEQAGVIAPQPSDPKLVALLEETS